MNISHFHPIRLTVFLALIVSAFSARGQANTASLIDSPFNGIDLESRVEKSNDLPALDQSFWWLRAAELTYTFAHVNIKQLPSSGEDQHYVTPSVYLESRHGLILEFTATCGRLTESLDFGGQLKLQSKSILYGGGVRPAVDLLRAAGSPMADRLTLILGAGAECYHIDTDSNETFGGLSISHLTFGRNSYDVSPFAVVQYAFSPAIAGSLVASNVFQFLPGRDVFTGVRDGHYTLFTLAARGDFRLGDRLTLSPYVMWMHEIDRTFGIFEQHVYYDWAQLGASICCPITERFRFYAGYNFVAFRPDYDEHIVQARMEYWF